MKLLSPVGNFESLKMAVYNGADEIYLGVSDFNARNNIDGFSLDDLDEVVFFAHINKVRVNLAVNILFNDLELEEAVNLIVKAYNKGVDCFIIQDLGLASILRENYPQIELHSSTQMGICNLEGAKQIEKLGFKRVVLARETPIEEIKNIKRNTSLEIEYFAQGALCVCFSGNCYLSSYLCDASGNRGKCKQLCRLPYELQKNGKVLKSGYLLSAKDFNMSEKIAELKDAGVDVLKIEGRARRPFYVAVATREYKNALNNIKANQTQLELAFNRGYTGGYFSGNGAIISDFNNHIGVNVGKVVAFERGKKFNIITFSSSREISSKSTIKIFDGNKELSTISLFDLKKCAKNQYQATTTQNAKVGASVNLILDYANEQSVLQQEKLPLLNIYISAFAGESLRVQANFLNCKIDLSGGVLSPAKSQALTCQDIENCFNKNKYFNVCEQVSTDGVFMQKSALNQIRREFFDRLKLNIVQSYTKSLALLKVRGECAYTAFDDFQIVENTNQKLEKTNIIYSPEIYEEKDICVFAHYCDSVGRKMYLDLPNFALDKDVAFLKNMVEKNHIPVVCNNYYALEFDTLKIAGGGLNVYNKHTAKALDMPIICAEDCFIKKTDFAYMTLRHCPMKCHLGATCDKCPYTNGYTFKMQNKTILKLKRKKLSTCTFYLTQ